MSTDYSSYSNDDEMMDVDLDKDLDIDLDDDDFAADEEDEADEY